MTDIVWTPPLDQTRGQAHVAGAAYPAVLHIDRGLHTLRYEWSVRAGVPTREAWGLRGQILEITFHTAGGEAYSGTAGVVGMSRSLICGETADFRGAGALVPLDAGMTGLGLPRLDGRLGCSHPAWKSVTQFGDVADRRRCPLCGAEWMLSTRLPEPWAADPAHRDMVIDDLISYLEGMDRPPEQCSKSRRQRLAAWLRRWEVVDRFPPGETSHIAYRFTRWGADWMAGTMNALLRRRDGHRVIVRRRR